MPALHWTPRAEDIRDSGLENFRRYVNKHYGTHFKTGDYWSLHAWSVSSPENINNFWNAIWDWSGVIGDKGKQPLFDASVPMYETSKMARHAHLNWAENMLLSHKHARSRTQNAVVACVEPPAGSSSSPICMRQMTFDQLYIEVAQAASTLKSFGVKPGDRVAAITPNNAEAIVMVLATSSIGAVWSASPPEFGVTAILQRFTQFKPKVLLTADQYRASGKDIDIAPKLAEIIPALQNLGLEHLIVVGQLQKDRRTRLKLPVFNGASTVSYVDFLDRTARDIIFWRGPAAAPLWCLYSSGTTGKPKAIVHNQLGMVLAPKMQSWLHNQMQAGDCYLQITTTGWMMWNILASVICIGVTTIAYDGNPLYPNRTSLFDLVDTYRVTSFALSPRYLQILLQGGFKPRETHSLTSLRTIFSAGSPLKPELYDYVREHIGDVFINNGSGGTDICSGFVGGSPILPIYKGMIQVPMLGTSLECYGETGEPVPLGHEGDLVVTKPFPNLPLAFLGDDENKTKMKETYYSQWPGKTVWYQADYMQIDPKSRGITMLGRSDGVLNPQGVRFGSAELYTILEEMKDEIDDCIAVGQKLPDGDERVIVFIKPMPGKKLSRELVGRMKTAIIAKLSRRHVPALFIECQDIPYTSNGKRVEVAVKKVINGASPSSLNTSGMLNPGSLQFFVNRPELKLPESDKRSGSAAIKSKL